MMNVQQHGEICGIANIGNTCYISAALQNLVHCYDAISTILAQPQTGPIYTLFRQFSHDYWNNPGRILSPAHLKQIIGQRAAQFAGNDPCDAQEFMSVLIDELYEQSQRHVAIRAAIPPDQSALTDRDRLMIRVIEQWSQFFALKYSNLLPYFYGMQCNRFLCPHCNTIKDRFETFNMIQLELPAANDTRQASLSQLIGRIGAAEHMTDATVTCETCVQHVNYWREIRYVKLPQYLFLHIKRFNMEIDHSTGQIRHHKKTMPISVDLTQSISLRSICIGYEEDFADYEICGAILHHGNMQGGHYVFIWKTQQGNWVLYDDDKIHMISEEIAGRHISMEAYMLTLKRIRSI
jgi:ubiquitin C-terminal hydrolase